MSATFARSGSQVEFCSLEEMYEELSFEGKKRRGQKQIKSLSHTTSSSGAGTVTCFRAGGPLGLGGWHFLVPKSLFLYSKRVLREMTLTGRFSGVSATPPCLSRYNPSPCLLLGEFIDRGLQHGAHPAHVSTTKTRTIFYGHTKDTVYHVRHTVRQLPDS